MGKITKVNVSGMTKDEWLALRSKSIGGSEIGAILGLNQNFSAYSLWCERTGRKEPFAGNLQSEIGLAMEPFVAAYFTELTGIRVERTNFIWYNSDFPHMHASPDRLCVGTRAGLEIKTTSAYNSDKFHGEEFPAQYYAQAVQYMGILEYPCWFIAVLIGNHAFKVFQLVRDESIQKPDCVDGRLFVSDAEIDALRGSAQAFWQCLEEDKPPRVDGSDSTKEALDEVFPDSSEMQMTFYGREGLVSEWFDIRDRQKALENRMQEIRNVLCADMGAAEVGFCGEHKVSWKTQERRTFDSKTAVKDHPELDAYYKTSSSRVFSIK